MKKRMLSLLCVLALCLGLLPVTALAVGEDVPAKLYVGDQHVIVAETVTYWTTDESGGLTRDYDATDNSADWSVRYNPTNATLTLKNATIKTTHSSGKSAVIYAQSDVQSAVSLTIELVGTNTIVCDSALYGIYVNAEMSNESYGTDASLTITGTGSLAVSGSTHGIWVKSGSGNASLTINDASVVAKTTQTYSGYAGVYVQSSAYATSSPQLSLAVNGGSLTTSASEGNDGIQFYVGSSEATGATTSLTVSDNAIVDAKNGGISASNPNSSDLSDQIVVGSGTGTSGGIVFDGSTGTVYGSVTLQDDLEIKSGETLTVPSGAELNCNGKLTNNGTINLESGGNLEGEPTSGSGTVVNAPSIGTQPASQSVTEGGTAEFSVTATGKNLSYQWQQKTSGSEWTNIPNATSSTYAITNTTTDMSGNQYRCVVSNSAGSVTSDAATLTVGTASVSVTGVSLNKTELTLTEGDSETLTATVEPSDATNQNVTWNSSDGAVATVDTSGNVTAVAPGTAAITVTTADGNKTAVCTVTVSKRSSSGSSGGSDSEPSYSPILETEGEGTVKVDPRTPGQGDAVTVTPTPDRGWDVGSVTVTDRNGREIDVTERRNSTWTFEQPRGRVTIAVTFVPAGGTAPFADVPEGHWAEAAIRYVWENGLMNGTSAASFNPGGTVSRQQVWMILARMAGADSAEMAAAKAWAVAGGISDGTSPGGAVTRQQFAALLYRFAVMMGYDVSVGESTNILSYADAFDAAEYAIPALQWACGAGIIHGTGDGSTLSPQGTATRAQAAVMLERFCEWNK